MFKNLDLKTTYSSYEDNLVEDFYNPVLKNSIIYDRVSAYFSAKALASYSKGLEIFSKNHGKYRLIISTEISEADYDEIKLGYKLKESIKNEMIEKLREEITLEEEKNFSNLAYLISIGIVDIKIAFTSRGIFHDKFGILKDANNNIINFRGSNNETEAAIKNNYEAFDITCSWYASNFDYKKIENSINTFERLWNNLQDGIIVISAPEVIKNEILKYNKNEIIIDKIFFCKNCLILDYENLLILHIRTENVNKVILSSFYKLNLKNYVEKIEDNIIFFKESLTYIDYIKIKELLENRGKEKFDCEFYSTDRLCNYINKLNINISNRAKLGIEIKRQDAKLLDKFKDYSEHVNRNMSRKLREKQMWDSFFMTVMTKAANFSVPGSGKTSSVLGTFSYLKSKGEVSRIVMIGPKNSFGSWIDEFRICFREKEKLKLFSIQDKISKKEKKSSLKYDVGNKNLILINYEAVPNYKEELTSLVSSKTLLVFDEVHRVKRVDGKYSTASLDISKKAEYVVIMTGTPIPNSYMDLYNSLQILFHNEYKNFFNFGTMLNNPSENEKKYINEKIQPFFCRTTKDQLNVPIAEKDKVLNVKATLEENKIFEILFSKYRKNKLAFLIRLLQLESNPKMLLESLNVLDFNGILEYSEKIEDIEYKDYSTEILPLINSIKITSKMRLCVNLIKDLIDKKKKVIVWCVFKNSIKNINEHLLKLGIRAYCISGEVNLEEREIILSGFKNGDFEVLITNPHTLAESVSLHSVCHDAIYFEYTYNLVHLLQSKDRIHRLGLSSDQYTQYYYLQIFFEHKDDSYSLDNQIYLRLQEKEKIMLDAIDNDIFESMPTTEEELDLIFEKLKL